MRDTVLLDLGGTLAEYYSREEFPGVLRRCITCVCERLAALGIAQTTAEDVWPRVAQENHEGKDLQVRPLEGRLARIFELDGAAIAEDVMAGLCRAFLGPILALARVYDDAVPALQQVRDLGARTALVSNTPWGSPGGLWREEVSRLGLRPCLDADVFCTDVGWRKPDRRIFEFALRRMGAGPEQCLFVGDHPVWDVEGARAVGIEAVLVTREAAAPAGDAKVISSLVALPRLLESL